MSGVEAHPASGEGVRRGRSKGLWAVLLLCLGGAAAFGLHALEGWLSEVVHDLFWEKGTALFYALNSQQFVFILDQALGVVLYPGALVTLVALLGRPVWERIARFRKGPGRIAAYRARHPVLVDRVLPWVLGFGWFALRTFGAPLLAWIAWSHRFNPFSWVMREVALTLNNFGAVLGSVAGIALIGGVARLGIAALTGDDAAPAEPAPTLDDDEKAGLSAVAVTPATRGAVAGLAVLSLVMAVCAAVFRSNEILALMVFGYVVVAVGVATAFRRVSRISVGIDGILVRGADRTRFVGYADLDAVEVEGGEVLLRHHGRTRLRLQMHDVDVGRAAELAARIRRAMDRATRMRSEGADLLMQATNTPPASGQRGARTASEKLASSARGGVDYRQPAIAREQLWQLVEGPVSSADARRVAAEALAPDLSLDERERLRVAAERCAEPRARVALERVVSTDEEGADETAVPPLRRRAIG